MKNQQIKATWFTTTGLHLRRLNPFIRNEKRLALFRHLGDAYFVRAQARIHQNTPGMIGLLGPYFDASKLMGSSSKYYEKANDQKKANSAHSHQMEYLMVAKIAADSLFGRD
jgi:hypothetical protein